MFPIRCYTCNASVAHLYPEYRARTQRGEAAKAVFRSLDVERMCCRRMFLGYVDLVQDQTAFPNLDRVLDDSGATLQRLAREHRSVACD
jgi:DNA-directed RNA polymerase subunit N